MDLETISHRPRVPRNVESESVENLGISMNMPFDHQGLFMM
jgi:hypothetical protein